MHLIMGVKESWINGFVKQWGDWRDKRSPRLDQSRETAASHSYREVDETWKSRLFWLEGKIAL